MKEAYKESIANIDEMIFRREVILHRIRYSFEAPSTANTFCYKAEKKIRDYGMKTLRECEKLKAIRSEMYWILKSELF